MRLVVEQAADRRRSGRGGRRGARGTRRPPRRLGLASPPRWIRALPLLLVLRDFLPRAPRRPRPGDRPAPAARAIGPSRTSAVGVSCPQCAPRRPPGDGPPSRTAGAPTRRLSRRTSRPAAPPTRPAHWEVHRQPRRCRPSARRGRRRRPGLERAWLAMGCRQAMVPARGITCHEGHKSCSCNSGRQRGRRQRRKVSLAHAFSTCAPSLHRRIRRPHSGRQLAAAARRGPCVRIAPARACKGFPQVEPSVADVDRRRRASARCPRSCSAGWCARRRRSGDPRAPRQHAGDKGPHAGGQRSAAAAAAAAARRRESDRGCRARARGLGGGGGGAAAAPAPAGTAGGAARAHEGAAGGMVDLAGSASSAGRPPGRRRRRRASRPAPTGWRLPAIARRGAAAPDDDEDAAAAAIAACSSRPRRRAAAGAAARREVRGAARAEGDGLHVALCAGARRGGRRWRRRWGRSWVKGDAASACGEVTDRYGTIRLSTR